MAVKISCPECSATLKLPDNVPAGKRIKCPKCGHGFPVPGQEEEATDFEPVEEEEAAAAPVVKKAAKRSRAEEEEEDDARPARRRRARDEEDEEEDRPARKRRARDEDEDEEEDRPARKRRARDEDEEDEEEEDRPRRRGARRKSSGPGLGLWIGLAAGVGVVFLSLLALAVWFFWPSNNPNVTPENFAKIKGGMTLADVEKIFGKGKATTADDLAKTLNNEKTTAGPNFAGPGTVGQPPSTAQLYKWKNHNDTLYVCCVDSSNVKQRVFYAVYITREGNNVKTQMQFFPFVDFGNPIIH
ncbi:MAG: hypothetical protein JO112_22530 [Planctomycetes bacterium]|nr:hypothetical protein [Planctomycetota bacterium]